MPVGRYNDDGEKVGTPRKYGGKPDPLGAPVIWNCPACGGQNEGRRPEQGCGLCGSGDPTLGKAGTVEVRTEGPTGRQAAPPHTVLPAAMRSGGKPAPRSSLEQSQPAEKVYRLLEYVIRPGQNADEVLRRSLVGTLRFPWGTLTGTVVDGIDGRQEDLLSLARRMPGVWLGNQEAMQMKQDKKFTYSPIPSGTYLRNAEIPLGDKSEVRVPPTSPPPDTGPAFTTADQDLALGILQLGDRGYVGGLKLCYTLALALQSIAEELAANQEPEKFLTYDEALALANALMQQIPEDWQPEAEGDAAPPPPAPEVEQADRQRARAAVSRIQDASKPSPVFREPPKEK